MVFSSILFLYYFLPIVLLLYLVVPKKYKNMILLFSSLIFYFYGEPRYILILLFSCLFNYYMGRLIENSKNSKRLILILALIIDFGLLFYFKYFNFFLDNVNGLFNTNLSWTKIIMPIGISFFTFQATSYVIDIYRGSVKSAKNVWIFATYLSLFPQLIAGPIVRYDTISSQLENRKTTFKLFSSGIKRFIIGLSKKVLIANVLGEAVKAFVGMNSQSILSYWGQMIGNMLQIYFDFSGYSDMAIGLGLMFGFTFLENFNYPFIARSITDFWRRWHISLSTWFKDYVYIPLGGSKNGNLRCYRNILIVWMATGLWHGASWNFILWGLYFAIFLIIEKRYLLKFLQKHFIIGHFYTLFLVMISFVLFNETTVSSIYHFLGNAFGFGSIPVTNVETLYYFKNYIGVFLIAVFCSTPIIRIINSKIKIKNSRIFVFICKVIEPIIYMILLLIVTAFIVDESFNPFLYFRF